MTNETKAAPPALENAAQKIDQPTDATVAHVGEKVKDTNGKAPARPFTPPHPKPENLPDALKQGTRFVLWKLEPPRAPGAKWDKVPYRPGGQRASVTAPSTWCTFADAYDAFLGDWDGRFDGIGRVLHADDEIVGVDLDSCVSEAGVVEPWAQEILNDLGHTYAERSPSGTGLRAFVRGQIPDFAGKRKGSFEWYSAGRFLTLTGGALNGCRHIGTMSPEAAELIARRFWAPKEDVDAHTLEHSGNGLPAEEVCRRMFNGRDGMRLQSLYQEGDFDAWGYPSRSEAELALLNGLAFWTNGDAEVMDEAYRMSALYALNPGKWDRLGADAIAKAIKDLREGYQPERAAEAATPEQRAEFAAGVLASIKSIGEFRATTPPPKKPLLHPWLTEQSITMVWGMRGIAKSFFVLGALQSLTTGANFGPWLCACTAPCLYLDAEMVHSDVVDRLQGLEPLPEAPLYIYSADLASRLGHPAPDLENPVWRGAMKAALLELGVKVFVVDNVASLSTEENDKALWAPINKWLLSLRFAGIATILVHHENKNGDQRGSGSREDNIDCSIRLARPKGYVVEDGARVEVQFRKWRVPHKDLHLISGVELRMKPTAFGIEVSHGKAVRDDRITILEGIAAGKTQSAIGKELSVDRSTISRKLAEYTGQGLLAKKGSKLVLTDQGKELLFGDF